MPRARLRPRVDLRVEPVTPDRWPDLERLFGPNGAYSNCWCTFYRLKRSEFSATGPARKKAVLRGVVEAGDAPGLLAYEGSEPVGWVAVAPRVDTPVLQRSPRLKVDDPERAWAVTCFFVRKDRRGQGVMTRLVEAAVEHARRSGAAALDAFPVEPGADLTGCEGYTGISTAFRRAGFRPVPGRAPLVRLTLA